MISTTFGQFGHFQGLGDIGDFGTAKKRRRGRHSFSRSSMRSMQNQNQQQQQQQQDSGAGGGDGGGGGYDDEGDDSMQASLSPEQEQAIRELMRQKGRRHRRQHSSLSGWGAFGRSARARHYHRTHHPTASSASSTSSSSSSPSVASIMSSSPLTSAVSSVLGGILGTAWGAVTRLAGWAGVDLGSWGDWSDPFGLFSPLRPSQSSAWAVPSPYSGAWMQGNPYAPMSNGFGHSEVETATNQAQAHQRRGLAMFLHSVFNELGRGDPRLGQQRLADASLQWGPDAVVALQEYMAASRDTRGGLVEKLRRLKLEYGAARAQGRRAEAWRLYYRINAIEARLSQIGAGRSAGPPLPDPDDQMSMHASGGVSMGASGIPWKPILIGGAALIAVGIAASSTKGRRGPRPSPAGAG